MVSHQFKVRSDKLEHRCLQAASFEEAYRLYKDDAYYAKTVIHSIIPL